MVERKIPSTYQPEFVVCINGIIYRCKAGSTMYVPDEVAAIIDDITRELPKENPPVDKNEKAIAENKKAINDIKSNRLYTHIVRMTKSGAVSGADFDVTATLICKGASSSIDTLAKLKAALGTHKITAMFGSVAASQGAPSGTPSSLAIDGADVKMSYVNGATGAMATYTFSGTGETIVDTVVGAF